MLKSSILYTAHCVCLFRVNATSALCLVPAVETEANVHKPAVCLFSAKGGTGYDLSLKDLSMIERIGELADAGVTSFKN